MRIRDLEICRQLSLKHKPGSTITSNIPRHPLLAANGPHIRHRVVVEEIAVEVEVYVVEAVVEASEMVPRRKKERSGDQVLWR